MDEDLKLVERLTDPGDHKRLCQGREYVCSCGWDAEVEAMLSEAGTTITRLHAEIEALKSDVADLVRAGSDEATENERLREALRAIEVEATREGGNWVHLRRNIAVQARKARTLEGGEG